MLQDRRTPEQTVATTVYAIATDKFMSGWGIAKGGKSYYAVACPSMDVALDVERRMSTRSDFKRVRLSHRLTRTGSKDHLSVVWHEEFSYGR